MVGAMRLSGGITFGRGTLRFDPRRPGPHRGCGSRAAPQTPLRGPSRARDRTGPTAPDGGADGAETGPGLRQPRLAGIAVEAEDGALRALVELPPDLRNNAVGPGAPA